MSVGSPELGDGRERALTSAARAAAILPIRLYQLLVSPLVPANTCKYHPSCSEYAVLAIRKHGVLRGAGMAAWRLARCNPWSHGGVDYP
ncbi:MAG TPA: membrane protein insertion efficiency factor YidD [Gaiellaceae bacterium]|nr:membrane protein insertion efficiency factor YidD [Gaiellaceae bacterium]